MKYMSISSASLCVLQDTLVGCSNKHLTFKFPRSDPIPIKKCG
jgi:hypothetical protein